MEKVKLCKGVDEMRDKLLQIRITQDLKDYIFGCAEKQYISVSQYIINLILADMEKK